VFDLRYHVASLAAVFIALAVGILLGVAISGNLSEAQTSFERAEISRLNEELSEERALSDAVGRRGDAATELLEQAYPALMANRLAGLDFALLFLGPVQGDVRSAIERTLGDAGAGSPVRVIAIDTPVDVRRLDDELSSDEELASYRDERGNFVDLGEALGRELVEGGETPLWTILSNELVEERSGTSSLAADGAIVVRSWSPPEEEEEEDAAAAADMAREVRATSSLFDGLLAGLAGSDLAVIGAETTTSLDSAVDVYRRHGLSSVDNVDTLAGRLALALLLAGGEPGHYGLKDSAEDGFAPPIEPVFADPGE
jgi:hypothetical protein